MHLYVSPSCKLCPFVLFLAVKFYILNLLHNMKSFILLFVVDDFVEVVATKDETFVWHTSIGETIVVVLFALLQK